MATETIEAIIKGAGLYFSSTCGCGGTLHKKYKKAKEGKDYFLDWMPRKHTFLFYINGKIFKSGYDKDLQTFLDEIQLA